MDDERARQRLARFCAALGQALGTTVVPHVAVSPSALAFDFGPGVVDLIWASPTLVLLSPELRSAVPLVSAVREGVTHYHGVFFVPREASFGSVLSLQGARVGWVARTSAAGYIFPRATLAGHGLDPEHFFSEQKFLETHGAVARAVFEGVVDVGATFAVFEQGEATRPLVSAGFTEVTSDPRAARIMLATPPIPADMLVCTPALNEAVGATKLAQALLDLPSEANMREAMRGVLGAEDFARCMPRMLDELRRQLDDARALGAID